MPRRDRLPTEPLRLHARDEGAGSSSLGLMSVFACSDLLSACSTADDAAPGVTYDEYMVSRPDATGYPPDHIAGFGPEDDETELAALQAQVRSLKQQLSAKDSQLDRARRSPRPVELGRDDGFDREKKRELAYVRVGCEFTLPPREGEISPCATRTAFVDTGDDWADDELASPTTAEGQVVVVDGRTYADA